MTGSGSQNAINGNVTAGYSGTPLLKKLGIKAGLTLSVIDPPADYVSLIGVLPEGTSVSRTLKSASSFIHLFARERASLEKKFPQLREALARDGVLWVSWPKRSSKVETDLNENVVREIGLGNGLVDVKVCAVDETWSGLKFVYRLKDRKG